MTLKLILSVFFLQTRGREEYNFLKTFLIIVFVMVDTEYRSPLSYLLCLFEFLVIRINLQLEVGLKSRISHQKPSYFTRV